MNFRERVDKAIKRASERYSAAFYFNPNADSGGSFPVDVILRNVDNEEAINDGPIQYSALYVEILFSRQTFDDIVAAGGDNCFRIGEFFSLKDGTETVFKPVAPFIPFPLTCLNDAYSIRCKRL